MKYVNVTITVPICFDGLPEGVTLDRVAHMLKNNRWNDGRHPFYVEMILHGLHCELKAAVAEATFEVMEKKFGKERIEYHNGSALRASREADKAMEGFRTHHLNTITEAQLCLCDSE